MEISWGLVLSWTLVLLLAVLTWHYFKYGFFKRSGLHVYPVLGILPNFVLRKDDLYDFVAEVLGRCPNLSCSGPAPGVHLFITANPVHFQHILKDNFDNYPKGKDFVDVTQDLLGHGIFTSDGEAWRQQRKTASYEFSTNSLRNLTLLTVSNEIVHRLFPTLDWAASSGEVVDMQDVLLRFTFDNICKVGFGVDPDVLSPEFKEVPFALSMDKATSIISLRTMAPDAWWKAMRYLRWGSEKELAEKLEVVHAFVERVVEQRLKAAKDWGATEGGESGQQGAPVNGATEGGGAPVAVPLEHSDLLSRMIALRDKDGGNMFTASFLRDACINFLIAGRDTTAVTMSWFFWHLVQHPRVEERILEEIEGVLEKRVKGNRDAPFSYEELKQLTYLQAALNESMRLKPAVPMDQKSALQDDVLPDGTFVGKGWRVTYAIYSVGYQTQVWGPDALEYKPERWLTPDGALKVESQFKFPVFNAGPRLCLGKDMAYLQMKSVTASVIRKYKLKLAPGHRVQYLISMTLLMSNGLLMSVATRNRE